MYAGGEPIRPEECAPFSRSYHHLMHLSLRSQFFSLPSPFLSLFV
jgi:hypothetical protein